MDTKWKSKSKSERVKAFTAFVAFILGISLTLGSVLGFGKTIISQDRDMEWWRPDWQETTEFKKVISEYLQSFLKIAAGEKVLLWYDMNDRLDKAPLLPGSLETAQWATDSAAPQSSVSLAMPSEPPAPDAAYQGDKNVLYGISAGGIQNLYTNTDGEPISDAYSFQLVFENSSVTITKDGAAQNIYSDGIYDSAEEWFVPGYDNFKAGAEAEDARIFIAVRAIPIQEYGEGKHTSHRIYNLYQEYVQCRETVLRLTIMMVIGVALLVLAWFFRSERRKANQCVANVTVYVWTEVRAILLLGFAAYHIFLIEPGYWLHDIIWLVFSRDQHLAIVTGLLISLWPTTPLFCLIWTAWLIHNDHRFNTKENRQGLLPKLRARDLKKPIEKRLRRTTLGGLLAMGLILLASVPVLLFCLHEIIYGWYDIGHVIILAVILPIDIIFLLLAFPSWKSLRTAKDIGILTKQINSIHNGDLSSRTDLPKDADLHQTAVELNDIQSGLERALYERTQSERMKVELISNVSHDLKTPLTSVLSYAALLEEENLPGAAGDYARIILEKAKRLDSMVQDVFSISKAASGQLTLDPKRLDLGKLLRQTLADMADTIEKSGLTVKTDIPGESVEIEADGERLYRVFQNLIQNALQYSIPGSRVYLSLVTEADSALATIRNSSANELPAGMDYTARFVRGDESRTDGGAGLGLSIASSFTEACGGKLKIETLADLFTVNVSFPLAK